MMRTWENLTMLNASQHSQREWLNARCHILEVAAILDRIEHAGGPAAADDAAVQRIGRLLRIVQQPAERGERAREILAALSE